MNKYKCQKQTHESEDIISVCLNKQCIHERVCCPKCEFEYHNDHLNQSVDFYFMSYFFEIKRLYFAMDLEDYSIGQKQSLINIQKKSFDQIFLNFQLHTLQILKQVNDQIINAQIGNYGNIINIRKYIENISQIQRKQRNGFVNPSLFPFRNLIEKALIEEEYLIKIKQQANVINDQMNQDNVSAEKMQCLERLNDILQLIEQEIRNLIENIPNDNQYLMVQRSPNKIKQQNITQIGISQDGTIVICGQLHSVKLWCVKTQQRIWKIKFQEALQFHVLSPNNQYIAILTDPDSLEQIFFFGESMGIQTVSIYKVKQNIHQKFTVKNGSVTSIIFSEDCQYILTFGNSMKLWSLIQNKIIFTYKTSVVSKMLVSTDNKLISCLTQDNGYIYIWNTLNRKAIVQKHHTDHKIGIDMCTSKDLQIYISRGEENIKIWKLIHSNNNEKSQLTLTKVIVDQHYTNQIQKIGKILLTSDEKYIISINIQEIQIHQIESGKMIQLITFPSDQIIFKNQNISKDINAFVTLMNSKYFQDDYYIWRRI